MTLQARTARTRRGPGKAPRTARGRHARPTRTKTAIRATVRCAKTVLALCVTGIVSVLLGAILGVQASPTSEPPDGVVVEAPPAKPRPTPAKVRPGPKPAAVKTVVLRYGDTLYGLAEKHHSTVKALQRLNKLGTSTLIYAGDTLRLPGSAAGAAEEPVSAGGKTGPPTAEHTADRDARKSAEKPAEKPAQKPAKKHSEGRATKAIAYARAQLGKPYIWGGAGPRGFDCSGLVMRAWQSAGVTLPRTTWSQIHAGTATTRGRLVPGDLVLSYGGGHVGLYIGGGRVIHAPRPGATVTIASLPDPGNVVAYRHIDR
ncbi:NlpC/P60 family protein [Streptomyces milbemycinicus]|uniref:NlpC/P60 family protein n=1 Tax=Streptomyces milbemycinicus TaxID=476552 RepID=A0ABW8LQ83_9ACTN